MSPPLDIVIPAAGSGHRMRSFGPKALIKVDGEPLVLRQIRLLRQCYPGSRVVVVAGFEADRVRRALARAANCEVVVNDDYEETNVAHSLGLALSRLEQDRPALVVYGDLVFERRSLAGMDPSRSAAAVDDDPEGRRGAEVGVNVVDGMVEHFAYGIRPKWAHVVLLAPPEKKLFLLAARSGFRRRHLGSEILNEVLDAGGAFRAFRVRGLLVEVDSSKDISRARASVSTP